MRFLENRDRQKIGDPRIRPPQPMLKDGTCSEEFIHAGVIYQSQYLIDLTQISHHQSFDLRIYLLVGLYVHKCSFQRFSTSETTISAHKKLNFFPKIM